MPTSEFGIEQGSVRVAAVSSGIVGMPLSSVVDSSSVPLSSEVPDTGTQNRDLTEFIW